jgi:fibronectin-binding autotransporter adhesin
MRKFLLISLGLLAVAPAARAQAPTSGQPINSMTAGGALTGTELIPMFQTAAPAKTTTPGAIGNYLIGAGLFVPPARTVSTNAPLSGGGALSGNLTLALTVPTANILGGSGTNFTSITVGSGLSLSGGTLSATGGGSGFSTNNVIPKGNGSTLVSSSLTDNGTTLSTNEQFSAAGLLATDMAGSGVRCVHVDNTGKASIASGDCATGGSGSVTSITLSSPGGIFAVSGTNPITTNGTHGYTTTGTSGGIPYFASTSQIQSSIALTAGMPIVGSGAGGAPAPGTKSGNTTQFVTTTGTQTSGNCVQIDASGNHIASGSACGGGGGGLSGMTATQVAIAGSATTVTSSLPTGATGNSTILQTDSGGRIDAGVLPGGVTTAGGTITATQWKNGQAFVGSTALTLPAATTLSAFTASGIMIQAFGGNVVLTPASTDGINGRAINTPITIPNGTTTICTTPGTAGVNAFTCPLGKASRYPLSYFSGVDYTAHPISVYGAETAVTVTSIICRPEALVGGTATIDLYAVSNTQIPPGAGTKINNSSCNANLTAGTQQTLTLTAPSVAAGSWIVAVFAGAGWGTPGTGSGAIQVSVMPN